MMSVIESVMGLAMGSAMGSVMRLDSKWSPLTDSLKYRNRASRTAKMFALPLGK